MTLTNQELIQELEKRIRTQQITLEVQPDTVKECSWSKWREQFILKVGDYQLNLTKLFEQIQHEQELKKAKTQTCNCSSDPKDFFSFFLRNFKSH